ncbi:hypothetical protein TWF694_001972 [Orbilia ellipsospora]|uniref:Peptidase metallopeptidase domain-containing protein n=1 Tax=Orbilia ellipsospora TaxID=2528407 RepID=A0AAV9X485_9PEZI
MPAIQLNNGSLGCGYEFKESGRVRRQADAGLTADGNKKWPDNFEFKWKVNGSMRNRAGDMKTFDTQTLEAIFASAFQKWAAITNFKFTKVAKNPNIDINVEQNDATRFEKMRTTGKILAYSPVGPDTSNPYNPGGLYGSVTFNNTTNGRDIWDDPMIHNCFLHEFGHVLGLGHSANGKAVMATFAHDNETRQNLTPDDVSHMQNFLRNTTRVLAAEKPVEVKPKLTKPMTKPGGIPDVKVNVENGKFFAIVDGFSMTPKDFIAQYKGKQITAKPNVDKPFTLCGDDMPSIFIKYQDWCAGKF